jgi:hypothetical protein
LYENGGNFPVYSYIISTHYQNTSTSTTAGIKAAKEKYHTPTKLILAIMQDFQDWLAPPTHCCRAQTFGPLLGPDILFTESYYKQFHQIGWLQLCLGGIRKKMV